VRKVAREIFTWHGRVRIGIEHGLGVKACIINQAADLVGTSRSDD
jgi:hypothetical protein